MSLHTTSVKPEAVSCVICGGSKIYTYVKINNRVVCTEDLMRILTLAKELGLDDMMEKLEHHHRS